MRKLIALMILGSFGVCLVLLTVAVAVSSPEARTALLVLFGAIAYLAALIWAVWELIP